MGIIARPARRRSSLPLPPLLLLPLLLPLLLLLLLLCAVSTAQLHAAGDSDGHVRRPRTNSVLQGDVTGDEVAGDRPHRDHHHHHHQPQQQPQHRQHLQQQRHRHHHHHQQGFSHADPSAAARADAAPASETLPSQLHELRLDLSALSRGLRQGSTRLAQRIDALEAAGEALASLDGRVSAVVGLLLRVVAACDWSCGDSGQLIALEDDGAPQGRLFPESCADIYRQRIRESGIYTIQPASAPEPFEAFCDMETDGGGWTVFQRRRDGAQDFNRTWDEYKRGFGEPGGEHWLGNDRLHQLTLPSPSPPSRASAPPPAPPPPPPPPPPPSTLRVELEDWLGVRRHAVYAHFGVASERERYRLTARGYRGDAGNALSYSRGYNHDGRRFSTPDRDHDAYAAGSCAAYYAAGWWFDSCLAANLNGRYHRGSGGYRGVTDGIYWGTWYMLSDYRTGRKFSFRSVEMKVRPAGF